jgi:hypothetical protein
LLGDHRLVPIHLEPGPHLADEPFACLDARFQHDVEDPAAVLGQVVDETKEGERGRSHRRSPAPKQQVAVEAQQRRLLGRDPQAKGCQPLFHFLAEPPGVRLVPKRHYKVIREARQLRVASAGLLEASLEPQVQDVVQVDIRKHGADHPSYKLAKRPDRRNRG